MTEVELDAATLRALIAEAQEETSSRANFLGCEASSTVWTLRAAWLQAKLDALPKEPPSAPTDVTFLLAEIDRLRKEAACPCCKNGINLAGETCGECHGKGLAILAYEHVRYLWKRQCEEIDRLTALVAQGSYSRAPLPASRTGRSGDDR